MPETVVLAGPVGLRLDPIEVSLLALARPGDVSRRWNQVDGSVGGCWHYMFMQADHLGGRVRVG